MSTWIDWSERRPPFDTLVLADYGYHKQVISLTELGDIYDGNNDYDDSGDVPDRWMEIPA